MSDILVSTTSNLEGFEIIEYKDVIYEEVIFAQNLISSLKNQISDYASAISSIFSSKELSGTTNAILQAKDYVMQKLKNKASSIGANAIIGIDFETSYGSSSTNIRISVNGTAVVIEKFIDPEKEAKKAIIEEQNRKKRIEMELKQKEYELKEKEREEEYKKNKEQKLKDEERQKLEKKNKLILDFVNGLLSKTDLKELKQFQDSYFNTTSLAYLKDIVPNIDNYDNLDSYREELKKVAEIYQKS